MTSEACNSKYYVVLSCYGQVYRFKSRSLFTTLDTLFCKKKTFLTNYSVNIVFILILWLPLSSISYI